MNDLYFSYFNSPIGVIEIIANKDYLIGVNFVEFIPDEKRKGNRITISTRKQLKEYFLGKRKKFDVKYLLKGTDFQRTVWNTLTKVPYGAVATYLDIAKMVGNEKTVRAIGSANSKNPISIIIPCHRIISSNGHLSGYAGGIERKEWLIEHEAKTMSGEKN